MLVRKLMGNEAVKNGDLVTIGKDIESGLREISGSMNGVHAHIIAYPIYRRVKEEFQLEECEIVLSGDSIVFSQGKLPNDPAKIRELAIWIADLAESKDVSNY